MTLLFNINILYAMLLGVLFGFTLYRIGMANPKKIIAMLALKDYTIIKTLLLGVALSSLGLFILLQLEWISITHLQIRPAFVGVIIGGAIFGAGWALAGFCPASSLTALGSGSKRALTFIFGGFIGAFLYMICHSVIRRTFLFYAISDGTVTLANTGNTRFVSLLPQIPSLYIAGGISLLCIIIAILLPPAKR